MPDLWRAYFTLEGDTVLPFLDALEELALACTIHEAAADAEDRTTAWTVDLLFDAKPDRRVLSRGLREVLDPAGIAPAGLTVERVAEDDWLQKDGLRRPPVRAGRFYVHGRAERDGVPADAIGVEVEAGLAFGSGEHHTTHACLLALDGLLRRRGRRFRRALDVGCGSGILGIAALKGGAMRADLVDNDPIAVRVTRENLVKNRLAHRGRAILSDGYAALHGAYDLIFANILADPLIEMAPNAKRRLAPGGFLVLSGLLDRQAPAVLAAHRAQGLRPVRRLVSGPWVALVLK